MNVEGQDATDVASALELLRSIAAPLIAIDGGSLYVVTATASEMRLHLADAYAGCPSNAFVERSLLAPLVRSILPKVSLIVSSGSPVPGGARRLDTK